MIALRRDWGGLIFCAVWFKGLSGLCAIGWRIPWVGCIPVMSEDGRYCTCVTIV